MKHVHIPTIEELLKPDKIRILDSGSYVFTNILYQGKKLQEVELSTDYLDYKDEKTQNEWAKFSATNDEGWCAADAEILYQCLLRAYQLRNDYPIVEELRMDMQEILSPHGELIITLTRASFGSGLDAVISSLGPGKKKTAITVPEFKKFNSNFCYLVLAEEQPENKLGQTSPLPIRAKPIMKALLGQGYQEAGAVFQYFCNQSLSNLRKVELYMPTAKYREINWSVAFGFTDDNAFSIDTTHDPEFKCPALGIRK